MKGGSRRREKTLGGVGNTLGGAEDTVGGERRH